MEKLDKLSGRLKLIILIWIFQIFYITWTASLDRIDSTKGYVEGNLQWVHRDINKIKMDLPQDYFIELCKSIINHVNQQPS